jgi:hypothetical protein
MWLSGDTNRRRASGALRYYEAGASMMRKDAAREWAGRWKR